MTEAVMGAYLAGWAIFAVALFCWVRHSHWDDITNGDPRLERHVRSATVVLSIILAAAWPVALIAVLIAKLAIRLSLRRA